MENSLFEGKSLWKIKRDNFEKPCDEEGFETFYGFVDLDHLILEDYDTGETINLRYVEEWKKVGDSNN
jgi:hypothetical protein